MSNDESDDASMQDEAEKKTFTPADRIRELLAIDADAVEMLRHAGLALQTLTFESESTLDAREEQFKAKVNDFTVTIQSVMARLRRQIYALEEADIIAADKAAVQAKQAVQPVALPRQGARTGNPAIQRRDPPMQITNGGMGKFDVGWLNSRIDTVGKAKEKELWAEAKQLLNEMQSNGTHEMDQT